jgi:hypothetical protein
MYPLLRSTGFIDQLFFMNNVEGRPVHIRGLVAAYFERSDYFSIKNMRLKIKQKKVQNNFCLPETLSNNGSWIPGSSSNASAVSSCI